jgi:hypothetical protein
MSFQGPEALKRFGSKNIKVKKKKPKPKFPRRAEVFFLTKTLAADSA